MKKFFVMLIAIFMLMAQAVFAADVPSFRSLDSENIELTYVEPAKIFDYTAYIYKCAPNTANNFIKQFTEQMVDSGLFEISLSGRLQEDYRKFGGKIETYDTVYFKYTDSKKISPVIWAKDRKKHDVMIRHEINQNLILIAVSNSLTFEDKNVPVVNETRTQPAPAQTTPNQNIPAINDSGADVPDFAQLGGNAHYTHNQQNGDGSTTYFFRATTLNSSASDNYVAKYISLLKSKGFVQTNYEKKKFRERVSKIRQTEIWTFSYSGSKIVGSLNDGNQIQMRRVRNPQITDTTFEIRIAKGLIFAGNYGAPKGGSSSGGDTFCSYCGGSGKCNSCGGTGYINKTIDFVVPCEVCNTSGKCSYCNGTGKE